jgi:CheY-like chemotaxis protein
MVEQALDILRHSLDRKIEIRVKFQAEKHIITGDPSQIQNAVLNLGINARDAMPDGGLLEVITENCSLSREYCEESSFSILPGRYVRLTIKDSGVGISPDLKAKIFEPFFTTKQVGKGTGLGLSAVFGTVTSHGGAIAVQSNVGAGTEFNIFLPLSETFSKPKEQEVIYTPHKRGNGQLILVIDDEPVIRAMASTLLEEAGYKAITAQNGQEGVDLYRDNWHNIDAVVVDMVMPVLDGLESMQLLKKINPKVRVLAASGFSRNEKINQMMREGAVGFLHKPYSLNELIDKLYQTLTTEI